MEGGAGLKPDGQVHARIARMTSVAWLGGSFLIGRSLVGGRRAGVLILFVGHAAVFAGGEG